MKKRNTFRVNFVKSVLLFCITVFSVVSVFTCCAFAVDESRHVMVQAFGWDSMNGAASKWYNLIAANAKDLADMGITMAWLPPCSRSVSQQGYMPTDYYDLGDAKSPTFYGTKDELVNCISKLHDNNIKALADIVVNHRCAGKQDENGLWNVYEFPSGLASWDKTMICKDDFKFNGQGNNDSGDKFEAAPDIDHYNPKVQKDIVEWMNWLKGIGFDGWRYDYVKGYAPKFVAAYNEKTSPEFSVGELWTSMNYGKAQSLNEAPGYNQDGHRQQLCDWLDNAGKTAATFDFTTKGILQQAVYGEYWRLRDAQGKASGLIGWWPQRAVTFIDNHDTGSKQKHWPFPGEKVMVGYAYILTHPGTPCVFWEHIYDWKLKDQIKKLIAVRNKYEINNGSQLEINVAENGLYVATIDDKIIVKLGGRDWKPESNEYKVQASGNEYCVWGK